LVVRDIEFPETHCAENRLLRRISRTFQIQVSDVGMIADHLLLYPL